MSKLKDGYWRQISSTVGDDNYLLKAAGGYIGLHTDRNNEPNKVVRTDGSGYIQAGWINTTSGNFTGTPARIYASDDAYIRYMTPANFFPTLANSGNDISITIGGQNRTLTVGFATNSTNARKPYITQLNDEEGNYPLVLTEINSSSNYYNIYKNYNNIWWNPFLKAFGHGVGVQATGASSHAEGYYSIASGYDSHAEGCRTTASGDYSHAEGDSTTAYGEHSHSEGESTTAQGGHSHSEGKNTVAGGANSHAEGFGTSANGVRAHSEGSDTIASGNRSHAEGSESRAFGYASHAEGNYTTAGVEGRDLAGDPGQCSHSEGEETVASGKNSHAEGYKSQAIGNYSHAEGENTQARGLYTHTEGFQSYAAGDYSHAEGRSSANGQYSHSEGLNSTTSARYAHAEGYHSYATGEASHAEGYEATASGNYSHSSGYNTIASHAYEAAFGKFNVSNSNTLFSVGYGNTNNDRKNLFEVKTNGNIYFNGASYYINGSYYNGTAEYANNLSNPAKYYWANLTLQTGSLDTTVPSFGAIRMNGVTSAGTNYITGTAGRIYFGGNFHIDSLGSNSTYINHYTANNVYLVTGGGSVGIGTSSPGYKLDVNGTLNATRILVNSATYGSDSLTVGGCIRITGGSGSSHAGGLRRVYFGDGTNVCLGEGGDGADTDWMYIRGYHKILLETNNGSTTIDINGYPNSPGFIKTGCDDTYVLTAGGGAKLESNLNVLSLRDKLIFACSCYATNTYSAYKITTTWPKSDNCMPTINIRGYAYGTSKTIDCDIVIYHYDNTPCNYSLTNKGSYPIKVYSKIENDVQVFYFNPGEYFGMFNVFVYGGMGVNLSRFSGWTMETVSAVDGNEIPQNSIATSITGSSSNSDKLDGYDSTQFLAWEAMKSGWSDAPFQSAVDYFNNLNNLNNGAKILYSYSGSEYTMLFTRRNDAAAHGSILKWGYPDNYIRMIRMISGSPQTSDWEKISAGYADSAGNSDTVDGYHFSDLESRYVNVTGDSMSGTLSIQTQVKTKSSPTAQQLVINGPDYNSSDSTSLQYFPGIGFHLPGRTWASLIWNGYFTGVNSDYSGYVGFYGSGFTKDGSDNTYVLEGGGGHYSLNNILHGDSYGTMEGVISDCNSVSVTGIYSHSGFSNRPDGVGNWGTLFNLRLYNSNNSYHRQLFFDCYSSDKIWTRSDSGGTWTSWKELITSANIGSQSVNYANSAGYATYAGYTTGTNTGNWDADNPGNYQYLWYYGQGGGVSNKPGDASYGSVINFFSNGVNESLNFQLYGSINHNSSNVSQGLWWRGKNNLSWDATWHRLYDDNYHPSADYANNAGYATRAAYLDGHGVNPDNSHPGYGARVFYSWNTGQAGNSSSGYSNGITIGSHPSDTAYGFQIVQNMWDDNTYTRRYNGGWQSWRTLLNDANWTSYVDGRYLPLSGGTMTGAINLSNTNARIAFGSLGTSPITGYTAPALSSSGVGIYSRYGESSDEGAIIITEDTCVIYNSADTGWNFQVMDKDLGTDMSNDATRSFGINSDHQAVSLAGFVKSGYDNSHVLLAGGGTKAIYDFSMAHSHPYLPLSGGTMNSGAQILVSTTSKGSSDVYNGGIQLREATFSTTSCTDNMYDAPGITFHWGGWWVHKLNMHSDALYWDNSIIITSSNISTYAPSSSVDYTIWRDNSSSVDYKIQVVPSLPSSTNSNTFYVIV